MKVVLQRVKEASVLVKGKVAGRIKKGGLLLVGVGKEDTESKAREMAGQISNLRFMPDNEGKMNRSLLDAGGEALVVSQFTLYADTSRGRRPGFHQAEEPGRAEEIYDFFVNCLRDAGLRVQTGEFGAYMEVRLANNGPVTFILEND